MGDIFSKILTYIFVIIIYLFIYAIIRMIFLDIRAMNRKKSGSLAEAYLKLINLRRDLDFAMDESYELEEDEVIGRGNKCTLRLPDKYLSVRHCRIYKSDGSFFIEDLGSTNGTYLNGDELADEAVELIDGDKISIGRLNFIFVMPKTEG